MNNRKADIVILPEEVVPLPSYPPPGPTRAVYVMFKCGACGCEDGIRLISGRLVCESCVPLTTQEAMMKFKEVLKDGYDKLIYPIVAPPAIAIVKLMTRFVNWMIDCMGENRE